MIAWLLQEDNQRSAFAGLSRSFMLARRDKNGAVIQWRYENCANGHSKILNIILKRGRKEKHVIYLVYAHMYRNPSEEIGEFVCSPEIKLVSDCEGVFLQSNDNNEPPAEIPH